MSEACDGAHPRRIRLRVAYHGARFHGWQIQRDVRTVEGVVTEAVARIAGGPRKVWGASRTDAGVHARGQVCCFDAPTEGAASERSVEAFFKGLNHLTPRDVAVMEVDEVPQTFHPRHSSRGKIYRYQLVDGFLAEPMLRDRVWHVPRVLDIDAMRVAAAALVGEHDFSAFRAAGCDAASPVRELFGVDVTRAAGGPGASIVTVEVGERVPQVHGARDRRDARRGRRRTAPAGVGGPGAGVSRPVRRGADRPATRADARAHLLP